MLTENVDNVDNSVHKSVSSDVFTHTSVDKLRIICRILCYVQKEILPDLCRIIFSVLLYSFPLKTPF